MEENEVESQQQENINISFTFIVAYNNGRDYIKYFVDEPENLFLDKEEVFFESINKIFDSKEFLIKVKEMLSNIGIKYLITHNGEIKQLHKTFEKEAIFDYKNIMKESNESKDEYTQNSNQIFTDKMNNFLGVVK